MTVITCCSTQAPRTAPTPCGHCGSSLATTGTGGSTRSAGYGGSSGAQPGRAQVPCERRRICPGLRDSLLPRVPGALPQPVGPAGRAGGGGDGGADPGAARGRAAAPVRPHLPRNAPDSGKAGCGGGSPPWAGARSGVPRTTSSSANRRGSAGSRPTWRRSASRSAACRARRPPSRGGTASPRMEVTRDFGLAFAPKPYYGRLYRLADIAGLAARYGIPEAGPGRLRGTGSRRHPGDVRRGAVVERRAGAPLLLTMPVATASPVPDHCRAPGPARARPASSPVNAPPLIVTFPLTRTSLTPADSWCGSANVARSATVAGSNTTMSA